MTWKTAWWRLNVSNNHNVAFVFLINFILMDCSLAAENSKFPEGKIEAPYEACKNVLIVSQQKYLENKSNWDQVEKKCNTKIQIAEDAGVTSLNPLKEGIQYLSFSQRVAQKVIENLKKNRTYAECSASCFAGAPVCINITRESKKPIKCSERKKEIQEAMKVFSRKIRMELALADDAPGMVNVNIHNALQFSKNEYHKDKFINTNLRDFEMGMPNPVGRVDLSERELQQAKRRVASDHKKLEDEFKEKGYTNYSDWMSVKLMEKMDEHKARYRELIYQEAPIFGVIDRPSKMEKGEDPVWTDAQIAKAFLKISENTKTTEEIVNWSLNNSKLEFSRATGESLGKWLSNLAPGTKEKNDLLYYIGMKNPVEEVLKEDSSLCGVATSMEAHLHTKELQNAGVTLVGSFAGAGLVKGVSAVGTTIFRIGRALTGAEAAGITGMSLGASFLGDSFRQYNSVVTEAETLSGLGGDKEGKAIRKSEEVALARDSVKMSLMFAPLDVIGGWSVGKTLYSSLSKQMAKDLPEMGTLIRKAKLDTVARDQVVDKWLAMKVRSALKSGVINDADQAALQSKEAKGVLETLTAEIEKSNPDFFKNPKNTDFFLKTAATTVKKEKGDPSDLGEKAKQLLLNFNTEAMNGAWDPKGQTALLKVFDNAIIELRLSAKNDPATYAKFTTDKSAQEKIFANALKRSGVEEKDLQPMVQCALPI